MYRKKGISLCNNKDKNLISVEFYFKSSEKFLKNVNFNMNDT